MATADKLSYLNTTKTKIRESINLTGAGLTTNDTFRSYAVKLKDTLMEGLTNPDEFIETIVENSPKDEATGTTLSFNAYSLWRDLQLLGDTKQGILPSEYQQVEYIESSGTQYIDTGIKPNNNTRVVLDFLDKNSTITCWLFGARVSYDNGNYSIVDLSNGSLRSDYNTYGISMTSIEVNKRYTIDKNKNVTTTYYNGSTYGSVITSPTGTFNCNYNMFLFSCNNAGTSLQSTPMKLYSCKIYDNDTLVRDYIPCYKISNNTIGLYDLVNNVFYTNKGTGTFTKGSNVPTPNYPQDIEVVTGRQDVDIHGKNICYNYEYFNQNAIYMYFNPKHLSQTFSISIKAPKQLSSNLNVYCFANGTNLGRFGYLSFSQEGEIAKATYTLSDNYYNSIKNASGTCFFSLYLTNAGFDITGTLESGQIESGNYTSYEPYKDNTYEVNLGKNLFDIKSFLTSHSVSYTENSDGSLTFTGDGSLYSNPYVFSNEDIQVSIKSLITNITSVNFYVELLNSANTRVARLSSTNPSAENISACKVRFNWSTSGQVTLKETQIEKGNQATSYSPYFTPIELCKIGNYRDKIFKGKGENLLDLQGIVKGRLDNGVIGYESGTTALTTTTNSVSFTTNTNYRGIVTDYIPITTSSYIYSVYDNADQTIGQALAFYDKDKNFLAQINGINITNGKRYANNVTNAEYCRIWYYLAGTGTTTINNLQVRFSSDETAPAYEPYNAKGKWYLHKEIGKVVLDNNSTNISSYVGSLTNTYVFQATTTGIANITSTGSGISNLYSVIMWQYNYDVESYYLASNTLVFKVNQATINAQTGSTNVEKLKTFLGKNNLIIYGLLSTPTDTEITNEELINQLESIKLIDGYNDITVNGELPTELYIKYLIKE